MVTYKQKLWITYAWVDNEDKDIDYIMKTLEATGKLDVRFDKRNLIPGQRIWPQIADEITNPNKCNAWAYVVTSNSLKSEKCVEELSYALLRALDKRGENFPIIGLLHNVSPKDLPPSLKIRLCISLNQPDWSERVVAAVEKRAPDYNTPELSPVILKLHNIENLTKCPKGSKIVLEIRPHFDVWCPFVAAIPLGEREKLKGWAHGPSGYIPKVSALFGAGEGGGALGSGEKVYMIRADNTADSNHGYYLYLSDIPSQLWVGTPSKLISCKIGG